MNYPCITHVNEIKEYTDGEVTVNSETETEIVTYKVKLPAVLCLHNSIYTPSLPKIKGYIRAHDYNYKIYNIFEIDLKEDEAGVKGCPTYVSKVYKMQENRNCKMLNTAEILEKIKEVG